jgi:hypothetical protein
MKPAMSETTPLGIADTPRGVSIPAQKTKLNGNQIRGFWAAWGGWCLDGMDSFIYALVLVPALRELLPRSGIQEYYSGAWFPDGKKILFSSNKHKCDSADFELYMVNLDGSGLEQVTNFGGFTAFPEFSPDGKKLVFVTDYKSTGKYEFNVFTANWK